MPGRKYQIYVKPCSSFRDTLEPLSDIVGKHHATYKQINVTIEGVECIASFSYNIWKTIVEQIKLHGCAQFVLNAGTTAHGTPVTVDTRYMKIEVKGLAKRLARQKAMETLEKP